MSLQDPAFPTPYTNSDRSVDYLNGMTKREYFSLKILNGLLSSMDGNIQGMEPNEPNIDYMIKFVR